MTAYIEAAMLTAMFVIGGIASYVDIRKGIIPNRLLIVGMGISVALNMTMFFFADTAFFGSWLLNMLIGDLLAVGMYANRTWAAGDTKLFAVMYSLVPCSLLDPGSLSHGIVPYMYIFLPALGWTVVDSLIQFFRRKPRRGRKIEIKAILRNWVVFSIETTALYSLLVLIMPGFVAGNGLFCAVLLMVYTIVCNSGKWMKSLYAVAGHAVVLVIVAILKPSAIMLPNLLIYPLIIVTIVFQHVISLYNYRLISTKEVTKGMVLSMDTVIPFSASRVKGLPTDASESLKARITEEEADAVKRWADSAKGKPEIWIVRKVPFAIMIEIGFILWIVLRMVL